MTARKGRLADLVGTALPTEAEAERIFRAGFAHGWSSGAKHEHFRASGNAAWAAYRAEHFPSDGRDPAGRPIGPEVRAEGGRFR
jgi:hypothetical protein